MANTATRRMPVHQVPPGTMLAEAERKMREYEVRYEMSSENMAELLERYAIRPTAEVLRWYSAYQGATLLRERTPKTGALGTTTSGSTSAG